MLLTKLFRKIIVPLIENSDPKEDEFFGKAVYPIHIYCFNGWLL